MCTIVIPNYISQFFSFCLCCLTQLLQLLLDKHWFSSIHNGHVIRIKKHIFKANLGPSNINIDSFYFYKGHAQWVWKSVIPINLSMCIDEHIHNFHLFASQCHFFFHNELIWFGPSPIFFEILGFLFWEKVSP
jgi:hypothetical protein